jgi:hypothetical protein
MDPDRTVIMQSDAEGNGYSPLSGLDDNAMYIPDSTWSGEVLPEVFTDELEQMGWAEGDIYHGGDDAVRAVILFPIN